MSTNNMQVLHYRYSGTRPDSAALTSLAGTWSGAFPAGLLPFLPTTATLGLIHLTDLQGNDGQQAQVAVSHQGSGGAGNQIASACQLMSFKVNYRYRGGHPRAYFPPAPLSGIQDDQNWTTTQTQGFQTQMGTWLQTFTGMIAGGCTVGNQCAVSYYSAKVQRPTPLVMDIISRSCPQAVGSQRRRLRN